MVKKVGLTGGIGSGKSVISNIFQVLGIAVYNSDREAKRLMQTNDKLKHSIINKFGSEVYIGDELNRKYLASIVFNDVNALKVLNGLVHPIMYSDFNRWSERQKGSYVINEAAILIESGGYTRMDAVILVSAPESLRISRVIKRDNCSEEDVQSRLNNQFNDEERRPFCDFEIINGGKKSLIKQVLDIHKTLS